MPHPAVPPLALAAALLAACGPPLSPPPGAAPGQPCSAESPSLFPVEPGNAFDLGPVEAALPEATDPGEAWFSVRLEDPDATPRPELTAVAISEPVLVLESTLGETATRALVAALTEARRPWAEGAVPRTFRVEVRAGAGDTGDAGWVLQPSVGCSPAIVDRPQLARSLERIVLETGTRSTSIASTLLVDETGRVRDVRFDEVGDRFVGRVRLDGVLRETRFHPAIRDGIAVSTWATLPIMLRAPARRRP